MPKHSSSANGPRSTRAAVTSLGKDGTWGTGAFQPAEDRSPGAIAGLVGGPDWYLLLAGLAAVGSLGVIWTFFVWAIVALGVGVGASIAIAGACALRADLGRHGGTRPRRVALRSVVAVLHILQPGARLGGRLAPFELPKPIPCCADH